MAYKIIPVRQQLSILDQIRAFDSYKALLLSLENESYASLLGSETKKASFECRLSALQFEVEKRVAPNVVHVYEVRNPNDLNIGHSPVENQYYRVGLHEAENLSLFMFISIGDTGITPPHNHHAKLFTSYTSLEAFEYVVPIDMNLASKRITLLDEPVDALGPHIVFFSRVSLSIKDLMGLLSKNLKPVVSKAGYSLCLNMDYVYDYV